MVASQTMRARLIARAALAGLALGFVATACGDGPDAPSTLVPATPTLVPAMRTATAAAATPTPDLGAPAPKRGANVVRIFPEHGQQVSRASTRPSSTNRNGVCLEADFKDLPENVLWFRMSVDGVEVTTEMTWAVGSTTAPTGGRGCYAPVDGLAPGKHSASIAVQNPNNTREPTKELVQWAFEVTP
jgi:hypothetical protein